MYFLIVFAYDTAYWGYWSWLPTYLVKARGFSMAQMGAAASLPSFAGVIGCVLGGWISDKHFSNRRRLPIILVQLASALLLYLTFTADTSTKMVIYQTIGGFFLESFFSAFWALPMNTVPKELMGIASGFINMAGQIAAFLSPIIIGYLVEAAGGSFSATFTFLVASILLSSAIVFMASGRFRLQQAIT
jgi:sugar phosphate permease